MRPKRTRTLPLSLDQLEDRRLLSSTPQGLSPQQLVTAYGLNNLMFTTSALPFPANGTGETIAIIDVYHDPYIYADLAKYDATFGLPTPGYGGLGQAGAGWFNVANLAGSATNDGWAEEEALDVETAHSVAPGANILVIEAKSDNFNDLLYAIQFARATPGVGVVSMSWGQSEFPNEAAYDAYFTTPAGHVGMTFVAASGDTPGVEWPASSPDVIGVGGTTLNTAATGGYLGETAWTNSGGGYSQYEAEPAYQYGVQSTGRRSVPDVAFDGDPNTGLSIYATDPSTGLGTWSVFGGTSLGAPAWAGIVAIIDEGYALAHILPSMDGGSLTLPMLYGHSSAGIFHGVTAAAARRFVPTTPLTTTGLGTPAGVTFLDSMLGYNVLVTNGATASRAAQAVAASSSSVSGPASTAGTASTALAIVPTV
ncbi:MAG TPA: S53 family peptidase, partial [Isosphaeraceae bacterium]